MTKDTTAKPIVLQPSEGRLYSFGRMSAVFKADLAETNSELSVSEWWLEPKTEGPPVHKHQESHLFYILTGSLTVYLQGSGWIEAAQGSYIYVPSDIEHGFENRNNSKVGFISFNTPGGFERNMTSITEYFANNPLGDVKVSTQ